MKRILFIIVAVMVGGMSANAQEGLDVAAFFTEAYTSNPKVTMVSFSGERLESRGMAKYKSISVTDDSALSDKIARAVGKDGSRSESKEVSYKDGMLYFGFYFMGGTGKERRYLLYLDRRAVGKDKTTLIYIEGNLDMASVKRLIKR
ncbi:MAG: hypothetical protein K2M27_10500 [Muribaculaceae bacterium]|nr:hypothetical protein [Muribaculaceae bacterium]